MVAVTGDDIAEEIVWCASRPSHVNIVQLCEFYRCVYDSRLL